TVVETQEHQEVGAFRKVMPLLTWFRNHTDASDEQHTFPVTRRSLAALLRDLSMLTPGNCHRLFPYVRNSCLRGEDYAGDYWYDVDDVKAWVSNTLRTFDFERRSLVMLALW
ncbi:hypothetical protein, partial [Escherichia coli]|uniref:hypothetical protein n=2 Tax=Enterobacterales TaxID=91347 RepID=UPI002FE67DDD